MKLYTGLILASIVGTVAAFSAVAPVSTDKANGNAEAIDKTMRGIDSDVATFDPTTGENPALSRNNNDQVWVQQVSTRSPEDPPNFFNLSNRLNSTLFDVTRTFGNKPVHQRRTDLASSSSSQ